MFSGLNLKVYLVIGALFIAYFGYSQFRINNLVKSNAVLEIKAESQEKIIKQKDKDLVKMKVITKETYEKFQKSRETVNNLNKRLNSRRIGRVGSKKAKLLERRVNKASNDVLRCFEILSGSPLTDKEKNAKKRSQINSSCPEIANPSFIRK